MNNSAQEIENIIANNLDSNQLLNTTFSENNNDVQATSTIDENKIIDKQDVLQQITQVTLKQQNISTILHKLGYQIVQQVVYTKSNQLAQIEMLKCFHQNNELVYIMLDTNGYLVNTNMQNLNITKISQENNIPLSLKENSIQIMAYDVPGVVFESDEALVLLHREKKTNNLMEKTYHLDNIKDNTNSKFNVYPMVYFSEIQSYPQIVCQNCTSVSAQLTTCIYREYCTRMNEMNKSMINLQQVWASFMKLNHTYQQQLFESIDKLNKYKRENCNPKLEDVINKSLKEKNNMLHDYLSMLYCITEMNSATNQIGFNVFTIEQRLKKLQPLVDTVEF